MPKPPSVLPNSRVNPEPALEKRTRRQFKPDYKLRIITEANACKYGELGAIDGRPRFAKRSIDDDKIKDCCHRSCAYGKSA